MGSRHAVVSTFMTLGETILALRTQRDWAQEDVAREAGISLQQAGRIERDEVSPKVETIKKIAKAFGVPPTMLLVRAAEPDGDAASLLVEAALAAGANADDLREALGEHA